MVSTASNKTNARIIGALILIPFFAYGIGSGVFTSVLSSENYLSNISESTLQLSFGAILILLNSICVLGIGILFYPILKEFNKKTSLIYLCTRIVEALLLIVGLISLLSIITISTNYIDAGETNPLFFEALIQTANKNNYWAYQMAMTILGIGSIGFCYVLFKHKLIPKFLSILGIIGYCLLSIGGLLEILGYPISIYLSIPGGLFEIGLVFWLFIKGLNNDAVN